MAAATGAGFSVSNFIDGNGIVRPQILETIRNRFEKDIASQTFLGLCKKEPFQLHSGNAIKRMQIDKMKPTTLPLNNAHSDGQILNKQTLGMSNVEMKVWLYGSFLELNKWLIMTQDAKIDPISLENIKQNYLESIESVVREYLTIGEKTFSDKDTFTFTGCPCNIHTGANGLEDADSIITTGKGGLDLGLIREHARELQMKNGKDVQVVLSQYAADALAQTNETWQKLVTSAYQGKGSTMANPLQSAAFNIPYMNCNFKIMQDCISEELVKGSTHTVVDNIYFIPREVIQVSDTSNTFNINTVGFDAKNINDPYNFVKSMSWQAVFGVKLTDASMVTKLQVYYDGAPLTKTVFDQLNV